MYVYFRECPRCRSLQRVDVDVDRRGQLVDRPVRCECERDPNHVPPVLEMEKRRMNGNGKKQAPLNGDRWSPAALREFLREKIGSTPQATARELFEMASGVREVGISLDSLAPEVSKIRKELGVQVARGGRPLREPRAAAPAPPERASIEARHPAPVAPAITAPPTVEAPPEPAAVDAALLVAEAAPAPAAGSVSGIVEFAASGEAFKATRRADGSWDVELRARVDDDLMERLAGVMLERVVGKKGRAVA